MQKLVPADAILIPAQASRAYKGLIYEVYQWPQAMFDGSSATFEMLKRPDTVTVIGVVGDKILVIEDEQPHSGMRLSFPGGRVDTTDETTLAAAQREIHEETGYAFNSWRLIRLWRPQRKIEWFVYLYIAWDGRRDGEPHLDPGEKISVDLLSYQEVKALAVNNSGYVGESKELFENTTSLDELLAIPETSGQLVDR